jgi:GNAT superfamily N-acetyltransferase
VTGGTASGLVVRRLRPEDWRTLREVRLAALADSPDAFASRLDREEAFTEDDWRFRITNGCSVVAFRDAVPVGLAGGYLHDGVPELIAMWVRPDARGGGAAGGLVDEVAAWAREVGGDRLTLWVVVGNDAAERLYRRLGFVPTGAVKPVPGNPALDELQMSLLLR